MRFPYFIKSSDSPAAVNANKDDTLPTATTATSAHPPSSGNTSISQLEKEKDVEKDMDIGATSDDRLHEMPAEKKVIEETPLSEAAALDKLDDEPEYPQGFKLAIIMVSLCLSVLLMALDNTIIAVAIPKITDHFKALDDIGCESLHHSSCPLDGSLFNHWVFEALWWPFLV